MQEGRTLSTREINRDLLRSILDSPRWFWPVVTILGLILLVAAIAIGIMVNRGLGVTGLNRPVAWGFFITNFVFWIGISHAGVMLSAILRAGQGGVAAAGHPRRRSVDPLLADDGDDYADCPHRDGLGVFSTGCSPTTLPGVSGPTFVPRWSGTPAPILTYLTSSTLFVIIALVPDFAVLRDHTTGVAPPGLQCAGVGLGGQRPPVEAANHRGVLLSALILPVFVSVHSIVSWDFGMAVAVKTWHSTVFAPYFVVGAVHSGVFAVAFVLILLRWCYGWQDYIRHEHIDALGRLLIVVATGWFYFLVMELLFGMYGRGGGTSWRCGPCSLPTGPTTPGSSSLW